MDLLEVSKVSLKAITHNKVRAFLTMLGIIIGVASVILLVSIGNGLQSYINDQLSALGPTLITVLPGKVSFSASSGAPAFSSSKLDAESLSLIKKSPAVQDADGVFFGPSVAKYKNNKVYLGELLGTGANMMIITGYKVAAGHYFNNAQAAAGSQVIVLGSQTATDLFGENGTPLGKEISVDGRIYTVVGVMDKIGASFSGSADARAYIPSLTYQKQFGTRNYSEIMVRADAAAGADRASAEIKRVLGRKLDPDNDFSVFTQEQLLTSINSILGAVTGALGGIAAISLLVGGIGIMNIMLVSVTERTREIGLRKAVGATPAAILLQFMLEAIILSLAGGLIGIALGAGGAAIINQFITTSVTLPAIALASGVSILIGVVFGTAPAISAARKDPIVALRYE